MRRSWLGERGQLTIPKETPESLELGRNVRIEFELKDGRVTMRPKNMAAVRRHLDKYLGLVLASYSGILTVSRRLHADDSQPVIVVVDTNVPIDTGDYDLRVRWQPRNAIEF